jgi:alkylhydroperoxidase family enzyme
VLVTQEPASVSPETIEALRAHGWSDAGIHDAIQVISYFNYVNRVADAVGIEPEADWENRPS